MSQKIDYSALDAAILAAVIQGKHRFINITNDWEVEQAVQKIRVETTMDRSHARTVDARLQALKKAGKLEFFNKYGWRIKEKQP